MKNHFFESALAAAKQSPEAFAVEFKKIEADANVTEYYEKGFGYYGDPLIHEIIRKVSDSQLPPLLSILIQQGVNLESRDGLGWTPLSTAASYLKKDAVNFLINNNVRINDRTKPALCTLMSQFKPNNELIMLDIVKTLLKHGADINIQDKFSQSPLIRAAEARSLEVMRYLLSQGANLFLKYTYAAGTQYKTALGIAYDEYISAKRCFKETDEYTQQAKKCLDLLVQATADYLYRQGIKEDNEEIYLTNSIKDLAGHFRDIYPESNSDAVKKLLEESIKPAALAVCIRAEKKHAFCMGSNLNKTLLEQKIPQPPVYRFFQNDGRKDVTREIFSYIHPTKKSQTK